MTARFMTAVCIAAASGFLALGYEVAWFRVYSFITAGTAPSFGVVLGVFLAGVALGALAARVLCNDPAATGRREQLAVPALLLVAGSFGGLLVTPLAALACTHGSWTASLPAVALVAALLGAVLPLTAHFGIPADDRAGERLSYLYLANIVGCAGGSMLTGFVLLDRWPLQTVSVILTVAGALVAALLFVVSRHRIARFPGALLCMIVALGSPAVADEAFDGLWEKLQLKAEYRPGQRFKHVVQNRSGVITVDRDDKIYGSGAYDGAFNVSPLHDTNMVVRPYALAGFHPRPQRVLMMGLSSGSWAQIVVHHPAVEELLIVEINAGYNKLVALYPQVRSLLTNPKVRIVIDDMRRWLQSNPDERFDAIVMNNSFHWRGSATNLLSREFMALAKAHMRPGGVLFYNTTENLAAMKTGCTAFRHGVRIVNFMMLSDRDLTPDRARWRRLLNDYRIDGSKLFDPANKWHRERIEELVNLRDETLGVSDGRWFETCSSILGYTAHYPVITDDNMATEWYRKWDAVP